jgi:hypothetical protein
MSASYVDLIEVGTLVTVGRNYGEEETLICTGKLSPTKIAVRTPTWLDMLKFRLKSLFYSLKRKLS